MTASIFDKDTILDITVNLVPLAILALFFLAFLVVNPWGMDFSLEAVLQLILVGWMFVALAILTYMAAVRIEGEDPGP